MKILKILAVNIFIIIIILASVEIYFSYTNLITSFNQWRVAVTETVPVDEYFDKMFKYEDYGRFAWAYKFRPDVNINSLKKPVLFMGCSFTYGTALEENETVSYKMAELTGRPVYNRGVQGWGLNQFLYMLRRNDFYTYIKEEPEYLIYIFISDHINRLERFKVMPMEGVFGPVYKKKNNSLVQVKPKFWDRFATVTYFQSNYNYWKPHISEDLVKLYFTEAKKALREHWKNTKLVILVYPLYYNCSNKLWEDLEKEGYKIIYVQNLIDIDLVNPDNRGKDRQHPAASTWEIVLPKIIKILGIN